MPQPSHKPGRRPRPSVRGPVLAGLGVFVAFFGGLLVWSYVAPLVSAAIAPGSVIVETNRKTVQHLEGGIVKEILVRDGDRVRAGQPLVLLEETQARAQVKILHSHQATMMARQARLIAERDDRADVVFPDSLVGKRDEPRLVEAMQSERTIFKARRREMRDQLNILHKQIDQLEEQIKGFKGQIASETRQLRLLSEEIRAVKLLFEKGHAAKPRLLELQRRAAEVEGGRSENRARIGDAKERIAERRLRISELRSVRMNESVEQLAEVQKELIDLWEKLRAAEDVASRTVVRAHIAGTVVGLRIHSTGGVIKSGEPLLDIVPIDDRLVIDARVAPEDIDVVRQGLDARVRLTSYNNRSVSPIMGKVTSVSADSMIDDRTGNVYFLARIALTEDPQTVLGDASLYPGMPAEVMIVTGRQTVIEYLLRPLTQYFERALREG